MVKEEPSDSGQNSHHESTKSPKREGEKSPSREEDGASKPKKPKFNDNEKGREFECKLCYCKFFTVAQYTCHIQSFEHRKRTIIKTATNAFSVAPDYQDGHGSDLPPGLSGRKVVHCKVCNVFTNSAIQLAEHLNGGRHKQTCFKFNVPITTLELTSDDTSTLEGTRLQGEKLMCKCCSIEINSMEQYKEHMGSTRHKLISQRIPLKPERAIKKALKPFYKNKRNGKGEERSDHKTGKDKGEEKDTEKVKEKDKEKGKKDKEQDNIPNDKADSGSRSSKVRDKYQLDLLDQLNECPERRNEMEFSRSHRMKGKKTPILKSVPYMCDICQVFGKSAFELNEHLNSERHKAALRKFLGGEKSPPTKDSKVDHKPTEVTDSEDKNSQKPELYCDICQLLLPSFGVKEQHEKSKKHKFLQELRKNAKTESRAQEATVVKKTEATKRVTAEKAVPPAKTLHCSVCQMDVESDEAMKEHVKSKKHKFLSELKPEPPAPIRRPEESTKHKRARPRNNSPDRRDWRHWTRRGNEEEEVPELAALALKRQALQVELAKRRKEIDEQRRLIAELQEEKHLEQEKAALRRMIDECRQLIKEREHHKRQATEPEESTSRKTAKSVQWHDSVTVVEVKEEPWDSGDTRAGHTRGHDYAEPQERLSLVKKAQEDWETEHLDQARSRGLAQQKRPVPVKQEVEDWENDRPKGGSSSLSYTSFSRWDGEIPLLGTPVETGDSAMSWPASLSTQSPESTPTFRNSLAGEERMIEPFSQEPPFRQGDLGAVFSQESFRNLGTNWPGAQHSPPVWSNVSQENDWSRPLLCTPSTSAGLLGDRPSLLENRPSTLEGTPSFLRDRPSLLEDRPRFLDDRSSLLNDRPNPLGSRPSLLGDKPSLLGDKPSLLGDKPSFFEDKSSFFEDRPEQQSQFWRHTSQWPTSEPKPWGESSTVRIPGLDFV
ncbi:titin homolog isoform X3 [Dermacentor silvarum]|uniref:titin homolog isoform X3 n=1 Tax=Dermacentor silvarum TaxID=543639 RepID=UPI00189BEA30|nr:titin homolog isoform X3 [Dermacentor silvarum]